MTQSPTRKLIVVVDDDALELMGTSYMFWDAGYRVIEAANAEQALQILETNADIRLLFTDVSMPGSMNGADLACHVAERWPGIGIIVASGRARPDRLSPFMGFHNKPYEPNAVLRQAKEMTAAGAGLAK